MENYLRKIILCKTNLFTLLQILDETFNNITSSIQSITTNKLWIEIRSYKQRFGSFGSIACSPDDYVKMTVRRQINYYLTIDFLKLILS